MTDDEPAVFGRSVEAAAAALVGPETPGEDEIAAALELIAEDGAVSRERVEEALGGLARVVSTPETRLELAAREVGAATDAAADLTDIPTVASRLAGLDSRLSALEQDVDALGDRLSELSARAGDPAAAFDVAREIRALTEDANAAQARADQLRDDAESTRRWLRDPAARRREFDDEVDAVAEAIDSVDDVAAWLDDESDEPPDGVDPDAPGAHWADATTGARVNELLIADLRAELADLRTMAERADDDPDLADLESRLAALTDRRDRLAATLSAAARPAWRADHGARLESARERIEEFAPPVDWGAVRAALDDV
ncbi:MAG: hypothetical protein A07HB70_02275 [uncultured archaeon A07HB70]|nr:MAG: hypothetical protein A07HB70_02275 [uncultured archaeon A07HB70]